MTITVPKRAYVGLGSNLGDRSANLLLGLRGMLEAGLVVARLSSLYETDPIDLLDQPKFLNMVAELTATIFSPEQTMTRLLEVEDALGRRRDVLRGPRIIDLDLLLYDAELRETELLTLPHPRLHLRCFVLVPLAELAPDLLHPTLGKTVNQLLREVGDASRVERWP